MNHSLDTQARKASAPSLGITALAGVAAALAAPTVGATVVSDSNLGISVAPGSPIANLGGMNNVDLGNSYSYQNKTHYTSAVLEADGVTAGPLVAGVSVIDASTSFSSSATIGARVYDAPSGTTTYSTGSGSGIYGVQFDNGAGVRYGWVDVTLQVGQPWDPLGLTLNGYGYEDSGASILAGQTAAPVPEPDTLAMMALGGLGLAVARRRQRAIAGQRAQAH
jgi:hypothetical protein